MTWLLLALATTRQDTPTLADHDKAQAIEEFSKALQDQYVFPELAKKTASDLKSKLDSHAYDSDSDGLAFVKHLNKDINDICHDAHLHISFSAEKLPVRKDNTQPSPEEIKRQQKMITQINGGIEKVERLDGNIGYMEVRSFQANPKDAVRPIKAAFDFLANTDALILDLRRNGGGDPSTVQLLCSYLFSSKPVHLNDIYFREGNQSSEFWTLKSVAGQRFENKPVYVLVSHRTGSGAEECAYDLQNLHRATIVGANTWGGANPGGFDRLDDHFSAFIPGGRAINPYTHTNWEGTGVTPDIKADPAEALTTTQQLILKDLLSKATEEDDKKRLQMALDQLANGPVASGTPIIKVVDR